MVNGTGNYFKAYHIVSSVPLTAYEFNPFDNSPDNPFEASGQSIDIANGYGGKMYTNDASLLYLRQAFIRYRLSRATIPCPTVFFPMALISASMIRKQK